MGKRRKPIITVKRQQYQGRARWEVDLDYGSSSILAYTESSVIGAALDEYKAALAQATRAQKRIQTLTAALTATRAALTQTKEAS